MKNARELQFYAWKFNVSGNRTCTRVATETQTALMWMKWKKFFLFVSMPKISLRAERTRPTSTLGRMKVTNVERFRSWIISDFGLNRPSLCFTFHIRLLFCWPRISLLCCLLSDYKILSNETKKNIFSGQLPTKRSAVRGIRDIIKSKQSKENRIVESFPTGTWHGT